MIIAINLVRADPRWKKLWFNNEKHVKYGTFISLTITHVKSRWHDMNIILVAQSVFLAGLYTDDVYPDTPRTRQAVELLPAEIRAARDARLLRATQFDMNRVEMPRDEWTNFEDVRYYDNNNNKQLTVRKKNFSNQHVFFCRMRRMDTICVRTWRLLTSLRMKTDCGAPKTTKTSPKLYHV